MRCLLLTVYLTALAATTPSYALLITHEVVIKPYQVCFDPSDCADMSPIDNGYIESFADDLYSIAGLDIRFLGQESITTQESLFAGGTADINELFYRLPEEAGYPQSELISRTFIPAFIVPRWSTGSIGLGWVGAAGFIMSSIVEQLGSLFSHELGHNLGLEHYFLYGQGATTSIMDYNDCERDSNCQLYPDELNELQTSLNSGRMNYVYELDSPYEYQSNIVTDVPEPSTWLLLLLTSPLLFLRRLLAFKLGFSGKIAAPLH